MFKQKREHQGKNAIQNVILIILVKINNLNHDIYVLFNVIVIKNVIVTKKINIKVIIFNKKVINKIDKIRKVYNYKMKNFGLYCPSFTGQYYTGREMYNFSYIIEQYHNSRTM